MITVEEIMKYIEDLGGAEQLRKDFEQSEADTKLLQTKYKELLAQFPDMWVAVYKGQIVADKDLKQLIAKLEGGEIPRGRAAIEFLATKPEVWVL